MSLLIGFQRLLMIFAFAASPISTSAANDFCRDCRQLCQRTPLKLDCNARSGSSRCECGDVVETCDRQKCAARCEGGGYQFDCKDFTNPCKCANPCTPTEQECRDQCKQNYIYKCNMSVTQCVCLDAGCTAGFTREECISKCGLAHQWSGDREKNESGSCACNNGAKLSKCCRSACLRRCGYTEARMKWKCENGLEVCTCSERTTPAPTTTTTTAAGAVYYEDDSSSVSKKASGNAASGQSCALSMVVTFLSLLLSSMFALCL